MLFYVALFLLAFIIAGMALWVLRALRLAMESTRVQYRSHVLEYAPPKKTVQQTGLRSSERVPVPWGWSSRQRKKADSSSAKNSALFDQPDLSRADWPYRDEPTASSKIRPEPSRTLGRVKPGGKVVAVRKAEKGGMHKPWGW
jgi:hypothetical protein